jgi:predicted ester cyclase
MPPVARTTPKSQATSVACWCAGSVDAIKTNFPDARLRTLNSVAEGEWVVVRCTYSGMHRGMSRLPVDRGMLVGVQPTGRSFEVQHMHMYRLLDGKIAEHFANRDDVGVMRQLGLLPLPARKLMTP